MPSIDEKRSMLRKFGLLVGAIFMGLGIFPLIKSGSANPLFFLIGSALTLAGLVYPQILSLPYALWMKAGHALGKLSTLLFLSIVFYCVLLPIGIIRRAFDKDGIFDFKQDATTYWIRRDAAKPRESMKRPY